MAKILPIGNRVLVLKATEPEQVRDGILIPESSQERPQDAEVLALGTADVFVVAVGDEVLVSKYGGTEVKIKGVSHLIVEENDILGIISDSQ